MASSAVQVSIRLSGDELAVVDALAAARGVSRAALVKIAVQRVLAAEGAKRAGGAGRG